MVPGTLLPRILAALVACWLACSPAWAAPPEGPWGALVAGVWDRELGGGLRLDRIEVQPHEVTLLLRRADGRVVARVFLRHPDALGHPTASLAVGIQAPFSQVRSPQEAEIQEALAAVVREVELRDPGDLGQQLRPPERTRWASSKVRRLWLGLPAGLLLVAAMVQAVRRRPLTARPEVRANHLLPSALQCTIYAYWAVYVSAVGDRALDIGAQLVFAYTFEALLALGRGRPWRPSFAPVPVVLSTNLFVWFSEPWLQLATIVVALGSKEFIERDGAHIFNPSALGVSVVALPTVVFPSQFRWGTPTPDVEMNLPPNMGELILCLALVAQLRFPIAVVPLGALVSLSLLPWLQGPEATWPATLLILVLFATDPKTLPKTVPGRLLYGLAFGVAIGVLSYRFTAVHHPDAYAKVLPIPVLNLLAPRLDRAGTQLLAVWTRLGHWTELVAVLTAVAWLLPFGPRPLGPPLALALLVVVVARRALGSPGHDPLTAALDPSANRFVVAAWFVLAAVSLAHDKAGAFQARDHFQHDTPRIVPGATGFPTCDDNPAWCRAFSLRAEVRAWAGPR